MLYQILALLIWGSSFIAAKYSYEMLDPTLMVEARLLIAALMVLPSCRRHLGRIPRSEWKPLLWISFVNYVVRSEERRGGEECRSRWWPSP